MILQFIVSQLLELVFFWRRHDSWSTYGVDHAVTTISHEAVSMILQFITSQLLELVPFLEKT
jgi:hypothetical protein